MDSKKILKSLNRFLAWFGLNICLGIVRVIPASYLYAFANNIASLAFIFAVKQKRIAKDSLSIAFGQEKSQAEIEKIAKDCFIYMVKSGIELFSLTDRPQLVRKQVGIIGKEHLDSALAKGKGVILVSAHFGNFPLMMMKLSLEGYKIAGIMRYMRDERSEKMFAKKRKKFGIKTIYSQPRKGAESKGA